MIKSWKLDDAIFLGIILIFGVAIYSVYQEDISCTLGNNNYECWE